MIVDPLDLDRAEAAAGNEVIRRYLLDRCALIESCRSDNPTARDIALEIWDHDVLEAERPCEMDARMRLEDLALKILDPTAFHRVRRGLAATVEAQGAWWEAMIRWRSRSGRSVLPGPQTLRMRYRHRKRGAWRQPLEGGCDLLEAPQPP